MGLAEPRGVVISHEKNDIPVTAHWCVKLHLYGDLDHTPLEFKREQERDCGRDTLIVTLGQIDFERHFLLLERSP